MALLMLVAHNRYIVRTWRNDVEIGPFRQALYSHSAFDLFRICISGDV